MKGAKSLKEPPQPEFSKFKHSAFENKKKSSRPKHEAEESDRELETHFPAAVQSSQPRSTTKTAKPGSTPPSNNVLKKSNQIRNESKGLKKLEKDVRNLRALVEKLVSSRSAPMDDKKTSKTVICFKCAESGHIASERTKLEVCCFKCNKDGVITANCPDCTKSEN